MSPRITGSTRSTRSLESTQSYPQSYCYLIYCQLLQPLRTCFFNGEQFCSYVWKRLKRHTILSTSRINRLDDNTSPSLCHLQCFAYRVTQLMSPLANQGLERVVFSDENCLRSKRRQTPKTIGY